MKKYIVFFVFLFFCSFSFGQNRIDKKASPENSLTKIILLRHAEKVLDGSKDPNLTEAGEQRAEKLRLMFSDINIDRVFSTPYRRTQKTVAPLANEKGLNIEIYDPKDLNFTDFLFQKVKGTTSLIVGHSNSIPKLVNKLIGSEKYQELSEDEYGKIWILIYSNDALIDCSLYNF